ncbi:peptide deformylase [Candidatus Kaiserbacteria bacterium]|nr:peptide deformylase [Candidatus Kaiserbacteria bacterium]
MKAIIQDGNPVLRKKAKKIFLKDIRSTRIQKLLNDMKEALSQKEHGVALAAPQIGASMRIFIIAPKVFGEEKKKSAPLVYINPALTRKSKKSKKLEEGCLSVEGYYGTVPRAERVTVSAYDENGKKFTRGAGGLLAQIFQHEIDHLDGILYTDKAIKTYRVEEVKK